MATVVRPDFYRHLAIALALFTIIGFSRTYYLRFLSGLPPLETLVHVHGVVFTAWFALFVLQTRLVAANRVDLHMKLGIAGVALAVAVVLIGVVTTAVRATMPRIHPSGLTPSQFTIVGLMSLAMFSVFLGLAIAFRRRAALHKRYMVLAMIAVLTPVSSRILTLLGLRDFWVWLVPVLPALFVAWCLLSDWRRQRLVHPVYAVGGAILIVAWPLRLAIGRSDWYQPVGDWLVRLGTGISG